MGWLRDTWEGFRIVCSREFWDAFREYWSPEAIGARLEAYTERVKRK